DELHPFRRHLRRTVQIPAAAQPRRPPVAPPPGNPITTASESLFTQKNYQNFAKSFL
ncbi:hypothetical protein A2U01_0060592, partial [Trifolium medium]|nr:hypothetical protein [Trifolium medium]